MTDDTERTDWGEAMTNSPDMDEMTRLHAVVIVGITTTGFGLILYGLQTGTLLFTMLGAIGILGTVIAANQVGDTGRTGETR